MLQNTKHKLCFEKVSESPAMCFDNCIHSCCLIVKQGGSSVLAAGTEASSAAPS